MKFTKKKKSRTKGLPRPHGWQDPSLPRRPQKMKPNLIKMDISKQQETQQQTHSCHFPATSCRRLGGGAVCVQMEVEATPPIAPRRMQISHSNKSYKGCLLLALPFLWKLGTSGKKGMIPDHLFRHGNGDPDHQQGDPSLFFPSAPKSPVPQRSQHQPYQPPPWSGRLPSLEGPKLRTAPLQQGPLLLATLKRTCTPHRGRHPETPGNPFYLHSPLPNRPNPHKRSV